MTKQCPNRMCPNFHAGDLVNFTQEAIFYYQQLDCFDLVDRVLCVAKPLLMIDSWKDDTLFVLKNVGMTPLKDHVIMCLSPAGNIIFQRCSLLKILNHGREI